MTYRNLSCAVVAAILALSMSACGDSQTPTPASSPVVPTVAAPGAAAGATVSGTVAVSSGPTGLTAMQGLNDITCTVVVSVEGTSLSTAADEAGRFKLTGVPSGTVQLKFSGNGMQGSITLTGVEDADQIDVAVTLSTSGASLTQASDPAGQVQLEGRVAAINPSGATNTLLVDSTTVSVPSGTDIRHGDTPVLFTELKVGDRVHVQGTRNGQTLVANQVIVQNTSASVPVNATGSVSLLQSGFTCPAIRFTLSGWIVETSASTSFEKGSCSAIVNGTSVHVKGDVQTSGRVLATWVQIGK